jgi:hypothetical protein
MEKLKSEIFGKVHWYVGELNHVVASKDKTQAIYEFEQKHLVEFFEKIQKASDTKNPDDKPINPIEMELELRERVNGYLTSRIALETLWTNYRIFQARLNRLLLKGYYSQIRPLEIDL